MFKLLQTILNWFLNRNQANMGEVIDSHARAQEQLANERKRNDVITKAAASRRDATDRVMRADGEGSLDDDPAGYWRD